METSVSVLTPADAAARAWLPQPYKPVERAACPDCGAFDTLVHSLTHQYIACWGCGWQRRPASTKERLDTALAAIYPAQWPEVLKALAARPADALPPVPALRWQRLGALAWEGPSRTEAGKTWLVTQIAPERLLYCTCPRRYDKCWHKRRAIELGAVPPTFDPESAIQDLYGP